jgi:hypothetical protein
MSDYKMSDEMGVYILSLIERAKWKTHQETKSALCDILYYRVCITGRNIALVYWILNSYYGNEYTEAEFLPDICKERNHQEQKHPDVSDFDKYDWLLIALEEYGEMVKAWNDMQEYIKTNSGTGELIDTTEHSKRFKDEAIQFASVIVRYLEHTAMKEGEG